MIKHLDVYVFEIPDNPINIYAFECLSDALAKPRGRDIAIEMEKVPGICRRGKTRVFDCAVPTLVLAQSFFPAMEAVDRISEMAEDPIYLSEIILDKIAIKAVIFNFMLIPIILPPS